MKLREGIALATLVALAAALAVAGCSGPRPLDDRDAHVAASSDTTLIAYGAVGTFGDTAGEARTLASIVFANAGGGQRVVLSFADAGGLPASTVGPGRVELLRELGVLRVWLPKEVDAGAMTQTFWAGDLASDAYLVRSLDGPCFVDVHLRQPAVARIWETAVPAALVLELRPGGEAIAPSPGQGGSVVLLAPRGGAAAYPLEISGYARTFEANVTVRLLQNGQMVRDTFTTAADYVFMWGEFKLALPGGPAGTMELQVGDADAEDGRWKGVSVPIEVR